LYTLLAHLDLPSFPTRRSSDLATVSSVIRLWIGARVGLACSSSCERYRRSGFHGRGVIARSVRSPCSITSPWIWTTTANTWRTSRRCSKVERDRTKRWNGPADRSGARRTGRLSATAATTTDTARRRRARPAHSGRVVGVEAAIHHEVRVSARFAWGERIGRRRRRGHLAWVGRGGGSRRERQRDH